LDLSQFDNLRIPEPLQLAQLLSKRKAGRNESLKLSAAFLNNIAVGIFAAGAAIPLLALYGPTAANPSPLSIFTWSGYTAFVRWLLPLFVASICSAFLHFYAKELVGRIED